MGTANALTCEVLLHRSVKPLICSKALGPPPPCRTPGVSFLTPEAQGSTLCPVHPASLGCGLSMQKLDDPVLGTFQRS